MIYNIISSTLQPIRIKLFRLQVTGVAWAPSDTRNENLCWSISVGQAASDDTKMMCVMCVCFCLNTLNLLVSQIIFGTWCFSREAAEPFVFRRWLTFLSDGSPSTVTSLPVITSDRLGSRHSCRITLGLKRRGPSHRVHVLRWLSGGHLRPLLRQLAGRAPQGGGR